jgi:transposase
MIVIGTDTHKRTHTCGAVFAGTGQLAGELTAPAREPGFRQLLAWGRDLDSERIWAIEDCRHVSGSLERFLVASGERVVRVPPKLMGEGRRGERTAGKSDPIDALAIARAALREGPETLPAAHLDEDALQVKLLLDHREDLVKARSEDQSRLRWHLHDLWPELEIPAGALDRMVWLDRVARKLARAEQGARVRVARELVTEIRRRTRRVNELEREIGALVKAQAPELLALEGCGALTAAKLLAETAGARRLPSDAKFARLAASPRSPPPRAIASATASIAVATAGSTAPCTASPSPRAAAMPRPASSSPKSRPRARPESKPCVASSATSHAESGSFWSIPKERYP